MKRCEVIAFFISMLVSFSVQSHILNFFDNFKSKKIELQDIVTHKDSLSHQYEFIFKGRPECLVEVNSFETEQRVSQNEALTLFTKVSSGVNKRFLEKFNTQSCSFDHCLQINSSKKDQEGLRYSITADPTKYHFEYRIVKVDGNNTYKIQITFYNQSILSLIDKNIPSMIVRSV